MIANTFVVTLAGLAAVASASGVHPALVAREEGAKCTSSWDGLVSDAPTPTGALYSWYSTATDGALVPASLTSANAEYTSAAISWGCEVLDFQSACSKDALGTAVSSYLAANALNTDVANAECKKAAAAGTRPAGMVAAAMGAAALVGATMLW